MCVEYNRFIPFDHQITFHSVSHIFCSLMRKYHIFCIPLVTNVKQERAACEGCQIWHCQGSL